MTANSIGKGQYQVELIHNINFDDLRSQWLSVQRDRDVPFFLTWSWISCWLKTYHPDILVVAARFEGEVVAIGLFTHSVEARHGFINSSQYRLHQMGDALLDQIWMEYNDFIALDEHRMEAVNACLCELQQSNSDWDEIILSMMSASRAKEVLYGNENAYEYQQNASYAVDLEAIRQTNSSYLETLHANTRYQIRRSMRLYEKLHGKLNLELAQTTDDALRLFDEAGPYHRLRWSDSGYKNLQFVRFHKNLIADSFAGNSIEMVKVSAGEFVIAILYYHLVNKNVFFYLQGLCYEKNNKLKPGLVAHALATQYFLDQGMCRYDYMGGDSQYKSQLAARGEDLVSVCIQKPSMKFNLEKLGQEIRRYTHNDHKAK